MSNICNYEEGCSLPSSTKYDLLISQLKREIEVLANTTEAKLLCHDGKIAEMCKYIKDNLSNTIMNLLDSMKLSGELDDIISESLINELEEIRNKRCISNEIVTNIHHTITYNTEYHDEPDIFNEQQGGTYIPENNSYIIAKTKNRENNVLLQEYSWVTGSLIREKELKLYHANWISYDPINDYLYISPMYNNENYNHIQELIIVKYSDLSIVNTINLKETLKKLGYENGAVTSCNYDYITGKKTIGIYDLSDGYKKRLFEWNGKTELTEIHLQSFINELNEEGMQGFLTHNNICYLLVANVIYSYDMKNGKPIKVYNLPNKDGYGINLGEPEQISVINPCSLESDFLLVTRNIGGKSWYKYTFACRTNLFHGLVQKKYNKFTNIKEHLYVRYNTQSLVQDGTLEKPFKTLEQALMVNDYNDSIINIHILDGSDKLGNIYFNLYNNRPIWILGYNSKANVIYMGKNIIKMIDIAQNLTNTKANEEYNYKVESSKADIISYGTTGKLATDDICCLYSDITITSKQKANVKQINPSNIKINSANWDSSITYNRNNVNEIGLSIKGIHNVKTNQVFEHFDFTNLSDSDITLHFMNNDYRFGIIDVTFQSNWLQWSPVKEFTKGNKKCTLTFTKTTENKLLVNCVDETGENIELGLTLEILK